MGSMMPADWTRAEDALTFSERTAEGSEGQVRAAPPEAPEAPDALAGPDAAASAGGTPPIRGGEPPGSGGDGGNGADGDPVPHNPAWEEWVREQRWDWLEAVATEHGLTAEEYEERVNAHLKELFEGMEPWMRIEEHQLLSALKDGEFKNQFQTGSSGGLYSPNARRQTEASLWGLPGNTEARARPKYGYLHSHPDGILPGTGVDDDESEQYGWFAIRFRPEVMDQATFTGGDSLDETAWGVYPTVAPARPVQPHWMAIAETVGDVLAVSSTTELVSRVERTVGYLEAQYHGRLSTGRIAEVIFVHGQVPSPELRNALDGAGIPCRVLQ
jgi:hypothetical protein